MSDIAILTAIPQFIRDEQSMTWDVDNCKAMPNGRPDPIMGKLFAAVHITERQTVMGITHGVFEELWGVGVTITKRLEAVPYDKVTKSIYLHQLEGISPLLQRIIYELHNRWELIHAINAAIPVDTALHAEKQEFISPLYLINRTPKIEFQDEPWFHGEHSKNAPRDSSDGHVGISMTAYFGKMIKQTTLVEEDCS